MNPLPDITHEDIKRISKEVAVYNYPIIIIVEDVHHYNQVENYIKERKWTGHDFIMYIGSKGISYLSPSVLMIIDLTREYNEFDGFELINI